jgi:hypothetical protein
VSVTKEQLSEAAKVLRRCHTLVYGRPGVGKTTLATSYPKCGLLSWDPDWKFIHESKRIRNFAQGAEGWQQWKDTIAAPQLHFANRARIVVDGVATMHEACSAWICKQHNVDHPEKLPHGRGWALVSQELLRGVSALVNYCEQANVGLIFIAHAEVTTGKMLSTEYSRIQPQLGAAPERIILKLVDFCWYLAYDPSYGAIKVGEAQTPPKTDRKTPDLRATGPNRLIVFDGGEHIFTKMRCPGELPVFPPEYRQLPLNGYPTILKLFAERLADSQPTESAS